MAEPSEQATKPTRAGRFELKVIGDYAFDECSSAMQKMVRANKPYEAYFYAFLLHQSGYFNYVWKRIAIVASEDVGNANPEAAMLIQSLHASYKAHVTSQNRDDGLVFIAQAILYLCRSPKTREADSLACLIDEQWQHGLRLQVPDIALDPHTARGKQEHGRWMSGTAEDVTERHRKWFGTWSRSTPELEREDEFLPRLKEMYGITD